MQHAFEVLHSRETCREKIENYANLGGDQGLTEDAMRQACGLPPRNRTQDLHAVPAGMINIGSQEEQGQKKHELEPVADMIMELCLAEQIDAYTLGKFTYKKLPAGTPNMERDVLWKQLEADGLMQVGVPKGRAKAGLMPLLKTKCKLADIYDTRCDDGQTEFQEEYDTARFRQAICGNPARESNVFIVIQYLDAVLSAKRRSKGKPSAQEASRREHLESLVLKLRTHERTLGGIMSKLDDATHDAVDPGCGQRQRRRLRGKLSESQDESQAAPSGASADDVSRAGTRKRAKCVDGSRLDKVLVKYRCASIAGIRSRRYAEGPPVLPCKLQRFW